jgi:uncharacterized protein with HEPN domain
MNDSDRQRLIDMLDEARALQSALDGKSRPDMDEYIFSNGISHAITLIGEAAANVSAETQKMYPQIEWSNMIGMRNFLVHHYWRVKLDIVWDTATRNIPDLIEQLEAILADRSTDNS